MKDHCPSMSLDHQTSTWAVGESGNGGWLPIFFLFGSCFLSLWSLDELRAATDYRSKEKNSDYRLDSYHFILTSREGGVNPTVALQRA
jgi:hypothetical protein